MASIISAGTSSGTAINISGDTSGNLAFTTQAGANTITVPNVTGTIITTATTGQSIPSAALPVGSVLQVVNASYGTEVAFTSTSYADTGLTASITPKFSTSKILVLVNQTGCAKDSGNTRLGLQLLRGATVIVTNIEKSAAYSADTGGNFVGGVSCCYLDSPATTSSTTYKTQGNSFSAPGNGSSRTQQDNVVSTITLMEIAA